MMKSNRNNTILGTDPFTNSGLYYYGFRFYAPNLQRWLNQDPIQERGGINLYAFVWNSPFSVVDLFGLAGFGDLHKAEDAMGSSDSVEIWIPGGPVSMSREEAQRYFPNELGPQPSPDSSIYHESTDPDPVMRARVNAMMPLFIAIDGVAPLAAAGFARTPEEPYCRQKHYPKTPTPADRQALGAGPGQVVDHNPPLVQRYYWGDPKIGEKPGYQMTPEERAASAADRSRMDIQSAQDSARQGAAMSKFSQETSRSFMIVRQVP